MERTASVQIVLEDPASRAALEGALRAELPGLPYVFVSREEVKKGRPDGGAVLFVINKGETVLEGIPASDVLEMPVRVGVALERLWRHGQPKDTDITAKFGPYVLHTADGTLLRGEQQQRLTEKENQILKILFHANGEAIEKEKLLADVWGYGAGIETHTLETHIYRLRQKIESDATAPEFLVTLANGYALKR